MATNSNDLFSAEVNDLVTAANRVRIALNENQKAQVESINRYYNTRMMEGASQEELAKIMQNLTNAQAALTKSTADLDEHMQKQQTKMDKANNAKEAFLGSWFGKIVGGFDKGLRIFTNSSFGDTIGLNKAASSIQEVGQNLQKFMGNIVNQLFDMVDTLTNTLADASLSSNVRLQGSSFDFLTVETTIKDALGLSPYLKQTDVYKSIEKLANQGIANGIEERAFLDALSKEIASTFDATSQALQRIVRLQQEDSTAERLGMEKALTSMLNQQYKDSSYMNSSMKSVSSILVELESQLGQSEAIGVEYNIQKWLGALSSLGMSENAINQIAQGMAYLGTGNVNALMGNEGLQRLMTMAIVEQGEDYAEILLNGLDTQMTNTVMEGVVKVLQKFGTTEFSQVVRSQFADLLGMSLSDFTASLNLTTSAMNSLVGSTYNAEMGLQDVRSGMYGIDQYMHLSTKLANVWDNFKTETMSSIAEDSTQFAIWRVNDLVEQMTGGVNIANFQAQGNGVGMNANMNQLLKLGFTGYDLWQRMDDVVDAVMNKTDLVGTWEKLAGDEGVYGPKGPKTLGTMLTTGAGNLFDMIAKAFEKNEITAAIEQGQARTVNEHIRDFVSDIDDTLSGINETINDWIKHDTKVTNTIKAVYNSLTTDSPSAQVVQSNLDVANAFSDFATVGGNSLQNANAQKALNNAMSNSISAMESADEATRQDIVNAINGLRDDVRNSQSSGMGGYYE